MNTLEITIPVLNEEVTLEHQVEKVLIFLSSSEDLANRTYLCIADNGSTDNTINIARELQNHNENLRFIQVDRKGVGLALKASWATSNADYVGYMDLDLATDLSHLPQSLSLLDTNTADLVSGNRLHPDSNTTGRSLVREFTSRVFNQIVRTYINSGISDAMCGFKFLRRSLVEELRAAGAISDGWFFCAELMLTAEALGKRIEEIPVKWTDDGDSKVNVTKLSLEYLKAMWALKKTLRNVG